MFSRPAALLITAFFLGLLIFTQLPKVPLLAIGLICALLAWAIESSRKRSAREALEQETARQAVAQQQPQMRDLLIQDAIRLELGSQLTGNEALLEQVRQVRWALAEELGLLLPNVCVSRGETLDATQYRFLMNGAAVAEYVLRTDRLLAVEGTFVAGAVEGLQTTEPMRKTPAFWILPEDRETAEGRGYRVLTPQEVMLEHLAETARTFAPELLSRTATQHLLEELRSLAPEVVKALVPEKMSVFEVQCVLQKLLAERVSIRPLGRILEALEEHIGQTRNPQKLVEYVRVKLGRQIVSPYLDADGGLYVLTFSPSLEEKLREAFEYTDDDLTTHLLPQDCDALGRVLEVQYVQSTLLGKRWVVLVAEEIRGAVRSVIADRLPLLPVLGLAEIPAGTRLEYVDMVDI